MLPPCNCITKIANNFVWGAKFENDDAIFLVIGKKELSDVGQKWMRAKLESIENMFHTHIKKHYLL
jgi:hypothetical protein